MDGLNLPLGFAGRIWVTTQMACPDCGKFLRDMVCADCRVTYTKEALGNEYGHCICGVPHPHSCTHIDHSVVKEYRRLKNLFLRGESYQVTRCHWEECLCPVCVSRRIEWSKERAEATEASMRRSRMTFVLSPIDVAGMFGTNMRLVEIEYDHEEDSVRVVLEGPYLCEWRSGCQAVRVRAKPLSTAYIMRERDE